MGYEINVALNGGHLFRTKDSSITNRGELKRVCKIIKEKFPESEGYNITITELRIEGRDFDLDSILNSTGGDQ